MATKIEKYLCCKVKSLTDRCERCRGKMCREHAVFCAECGDTCTRCVEKRTCTVCDLAICSKCTRVGSDLKVKCSTCFADQDNGGFSESEEYDALQI